LLNTTGKTTPPPIAAMPQAPVQQTSEAPYPAEMQQTQEDALSQPAIA